MKTVQNSSIKNRTKWLITIFCVIQVIISIHMNQVAQASWYPLIHLTSGQEIMSSMEDPLAEATPVVQYKEVGGMLVIPFILVLVLVTAVGLILYIRYDKKQHPNH